jgi:hypothetical protein
MAGLRDRRSRPRRSPRRSWVEQVMEIERLRRERWTGVRIARKVALSPATISRVLRRLELNRNRDLEPHLAPIRYEHAAPGDLVPLDIKTSGGNPADVAPGHRQPKDGVKGIGAEFLHIAIDDHSRIAFTAMYPDQTERSSMHFLAATVAWFGQIGIGIQPPQTTYETQPTSTHQPGRFR